MPVVSRLDGSAGGKIESRLIRLTGPPHPARNAAMAPATTGVFGVNTGDPWRADAFDNCRAKPSGRLSKTPPSTKLQVTGRRHSFGSSYLRRHGGFASG